MGAAASIAHPDFVSSLLHGSSDAVRSDGPTVNDPSPSNNSLQVSRSADNAKGRLRKKPRDVSPVSLDRVNRRKDKGKGHRRLHSKIKDFFLGIDALLAPDDQELPEKRHSHDGSRDVRPVITPELPHASPSSAPVEGDEGSPVLPGQQKTLSDDYTGKIAKAENGLIRHGGFSDVYEGIVTESGYRVAIKALRATNMAPGDDAATCQERLRKRLLREMLVLGKIRHARIAYLVGHATFEERPALILPWYSNGCLPEYLNRTPDANRQKLILQVAEGLAHLHSYDPPIAHSDIKPQNVLIDDVGDAALTDFGLARLLDGERTGLTTSKDPVFTIRYCSPEAIEGARPTTMADVYSFACLTFEILTGAWPYAELKGMTSLLRAKSLYQTPQRGTSKALTDPIWTLLVSCWDKEPEARPKMNQVVDELKALGWQS